MKHSEAMAASVETAIGETSGNVSFWTLTENVDAVLAIFADVLLHPEFRQDKLDLTVQQARGAIARRNDDAAGIASREFRNLIYGGDTPYGWQIEYEHLDAITRDDLLAFYRRYVFPANVKLALYGDFSSEEMKAKIEKAFAGWTSEQPPVPAFPAVERRPKGGVFVVEKSRRQSNEHSDGAPRRAAQRRRLPGVAGVEHHLRGRIPEPFVSTGAH